MAAMRPFRVTGKPPRDARWVDLNKGGEGKYDVRCRWVAEETKPTGPTGVRSATTDGNLDIYHYNPWS